jgi:diacylglycerol kinase family enzyme
MGFLLMLFILCVGGCWLLAKLFGEAMFGKSDNKNTYVDKSVHHHYHDNRSINVDGETFKKLK